jgi:hypothetical protein
MSKEAIWEAIKEPLRLLVLAIIPFALAYFSVLPYQWAITLTLILRAIDKYLHEVAKEVPAKQQNEGLLGIKGLTGF